MSHEESDRSQPPASMNNSERLQEIKERFAKLGWLSREDILWLIEVLGEMIGVKGDRT